MSVQLERFGPRAEIVSDHSDGRQVIEAVIGDTRYVCRTLADDGEWGTWFHQREDGTRGTCVSGEEERLLDAALNQRRAS